MHSHPTLPRPWCMREARLNAIPENYKWSQSAEADKQIAMDVLGNGRPKSRLGSVQSSVLVNCMRTGRRTVTIRVYSGSFSPYDPSGGYQGAGALIISNHSEIRLADESRTTSGHLRVWVGGGRFPSTREHGIM
ncbi:hypothetical protein OE88DRAFT_1036942 [Heliocybe sulcata]|uniref:Uncharacterized protein n=1 Tax=Heliocybe sulcata TaxID=5364 RepID=A0A5C3MQ28_9AGAM|nr:hypothetical protein OE88DRAFT_1036942 [Heliocybe sulcata]